MITDVVGVRVGHWTHPERRTGCTVALFPAGTVASGEIRGGAPGTREWDLLAPERLVQHLDAVVLTGGSAFGLAACDGVMRFCEERGMGVVTRAGPVPIVVGAVLFDLGGDASARPGPAEGYAACEAANAGPVAVGRVGAGAGATVGGWRGRERARPGGVGSASVRHREVVVGALVAVNAYGGPTGEDDDDLAALDGVGRVGLLTNTTVGVVSTNAALDKVGCLLMAQGAQDGLVRALEPAHATVDGDAFVGAAVGGVDAPVDLVRLLASRAVQRAVATAVRQAGGH